MSKTWFPWLTLASSVAVLGPVGWAADKPVDSAWATLPVVVDGVNKEWLDARLILDEESGAEFAVRNDAGNLYLLFVFKDRRALTTIEQTGMTVYFSTEGKNKKDRGLHFVKRQLTADELIKDLEKKGEVLEDGRKAEIRTHKAFVVYLADIINKKKIPSPSDPSVQTESPHFRYLPGQGMVVYEFRIPLSRVNQPGGIGTEPGQTVKVGFEWGGRSAEMRQAMMAQRSARSSQATSSASSIESALRDTSGDGAGGGGGSDLDFQRSPKKYSFWIDLKLAVQN